jgi:hypothetical protein
VTRWVQPLPTDEHQGLLLLLDVATSKDHSLHLGGKVHLKGEAKDCDYLATLGACCRNAYRDALVRADQQLVLHHGRPVGTAV